MYHALYRVQIRTTQLNGRSEMGQINPILQKYCSLARVFIRITDRLTAIKTSIICEKCGV
jgi:hypothetical protein